jgi:dihydropteroate synthase
VNSAHQSTVFSTNKTLNFQGRLINLDVPRIMGILNVTPDSFYDGGRYVLERQILEQTEKMIKAGATFIDVGGYSSRPGAEDIPLEEELNRVVGAIRTIVRSFPQSLLAVDTFRSEIASAAVHEGAVMVNDISGGDLDPKMPETIARLKVPFITMHMKGTPQTMSQMTGYENMLKEIMEALQSKINRFHHLGIRDLIIDPGFGFAKTVDQNFLLLNRLESLRLLGKPVMVGLSRKSMIWRTLKITPEEALNGTASLHTIALLKGASILRVHDVKEAAEIVALVEKTTNLSND